MVAQKQIKNKSKANQKHLIKHSSLNGDLPEIIKAFQILMSATENGQTKSELTKCFTSIIVGGLV